MIHHDSVLFQKAGTTGFRTGSLWCIDVLYLSPGAPLEFLLPDYLLSQLHCSFALNSDSITEGTDAQRVVCSGA